MVFCASKAYTTDDAIIAIHGVPYRGCRAENAAGKYPSSAIVEGMRVLVSTVAFSNATLPIIAASVMGIPSHGPPISCAAVEKYPVCHFSQSPSAANEKNVGRKYVAIESGTTIAKARGYVLCGFSTSSATLESCSYPE